MSPERTQALIAENRDAFDSLVAHAARAVGQSKFQIAAARLQSAARFAWYSYPGAFRSLELEALAARISRDLPAPTRRSEGLEGHVIHVLTQAYAAGGHTRLAWRWIENDAGHVSSVVLTGQQGIPVPPQLLAAVEASGGQIISLGDESSSLVMRAARLRQIAESGVAGIVLHVHPYDVVPSMGLADVDTTVVFLNHADHVFWVGGEIADVVADIRPAGQQLSLTQRGVEPERSTILPIPLASPPRSDDKHAARDRLGLPADALVVLSIASGYKYGALPGHHFADIHLAFVLAHPEVRLIVVGPESKDRWQEVSEATGGRFSAVGIVDDIESYYAAADIYVDSIPFASLTSLLDAAARGLPVLALNETVADSVLTSNDISLVDKGVHYSDRTDYIRELEILAGAPEARRRLADSVSEAVAFHHTAPGWNLHLERLTAMLESSGVDAASTRSPLIDPPAAYKGLGDALVDFQQASGLSEPAWSCALRDAPYLPLAERLKLLVSTPQGSRISSLKFMIPDATRTSLKRILVRRK